jgi:hypothetical protein
MRRKLDFDGEFDEFISIKRQRYNNAVSAEGKLKTDGLNIVVPPSPVLNAPVLSGGMASGIVTGGGNPTPVLNAPILSGGMASGIVTTGGNPTPVLNLPSLPVGNIIVASPSSGSTISSQTEGKYGNGVVTGSITSSSSGSTTSPAPTPTSTGTTTTSSSTPTFTEGILIGSGLLGGALNNATSPAPRFGGGGGSSSTSNNKETKEQQIPVYNKPKSTPTSHAFFKPLIIGSVILGAAYIMLKAK